MQQNTDKAGTMDYAATTALEVHQAGTTEDGYPRLADYWVLLATAEDGTRFRARRSFCSDDYDVLGGAEKAALAFVEVVQAALDAGAAPAASDKWVTVDPAYGSVAYRREGIEEIRAARERQDYERGL